MSANTIKAIELDTTDPKYATLHKLRRTLEAAGVIFIEPDDAWTWGSSQQVPTGQEVGVTCGTKPGDGRMRGWVVLGHSTPSSLLLGLDWPAPFQSGPLSRQFEMAALYGALGRGNGNLRHQNWFVARGRGRKGCG